MVRRSLEFRFGESSRRNPGNKPAHGGQVEARPKGSSSGSSETIPADCYVIARVISRPELNL